MRKLLIIGGTILAFFISLQLIENLPSMFSSLQSSILLSIVVGIILLIIFKVLFSR